MQTFGAQLFNAPKWQAVLAMEDRYFHSAFMFVSFNMPFFVVYAIFAFEISPDFNKRFVLIPII